MSEFAKPARIIKGRGSSSRTVSRFDKRIYTAEDDGWYQEQDEAPRLPTEVREDIARSIISRNESPDVGFSQSVNPYKGCEHGL